MQLNIPFDGPIQSTQPDDVTQGGDGFYYRMTAAGSKRVCEDCWEPIPRYVDFPEGLTSPESDGDAGGNFAKWRPASIEGKEGREALRKAVCLPCYFAAFERVYPGADLPELRSDVMAVAVQQKYVPEPEAPLVLVPEPQGI